MRAYKFIVSELVPGTVFSRTGALAVVTAETEEEARAAVQNYAADAGFDASWLSLARVVEFNLTAPGVIAFVTVY